METDIPSRKNRFGDLFWSVSLKCTDATACLRKTFVSSFGFAINFFVCVCCMPCTKPEKSYCCESWSFLILENDIEGMDDSWNVSEDCQEDVDKEINTASSLEEHTNRWQEDREDDLDNISILLLVINRNVLKLELWSGYLTSRTWTRSGPSPEIEQNWTSQTSWTWKSCNIYDMYIGQYVHRNRLIYTRSGTARNLRCCENHFCWYFWKLLVVSLQMCRPCSLCNWLIYPHVYNRNVITAIGDDE